MLLILAERSVALEAAIHQNMNYDLLAIAWWGLLADAVLTEQEAFDEPVKTILTRFATPSALA